MRISKIAVNIICGVFEAVFLAVSILACIPVAGFAQSEVPLYVKMAFELSLALAFSLLAATIVIHVLALKSPRTAEENKASEEKKMDGQKSVSKSA